MIKDWIKCVFIGLFWGGIIVVLSYLIWDFLLSPLLTQVLDSSVYYGWPINLVWPVEIFYIVIFVFLPVSILSKDLNIPFLGAVVGLIGGIIVMVLIPEFGRVHAFDKMSFAIMCMCCGIAINRNIKAQFQEKDDTSLVLDS